MCFAPDTLIALADGEKKQISDLRIGERVRSGPSPYDLAVVKHIYALKSTPVREISFVEPGFLERESERPNKLVCTDEHLFWVDGKGWTAAEDLQIGDWLITYTGAHAVVIGNSALGEKSNVYTVRLAGDHAFYANDVLAHDLCGETLPPGAEQKVGVAK